MLLRYGASERGKIEKKAHIYLRDEHGIDPRLVDPDAVWVIRRLRKEGHHAYVVGGAVRDLLLGRKPNDFDIATDALPQRIRRVFHSARLIGRRFRIVHVYVAREKYLEVTTFRSNKGDGSENLFGTLEEDAQRRDFTINALYYSPLEEQLIDYVGGLADLKARRLKTLIPSEVSFSEDPVRMIRAVKYACLTGFPVPPGMASLMKRMREGILECSRERVTEEVYKMLTSGSAAEIFELAHKLKLFDVLFPAIAAASKESRTKFSEAPLYVRARELDERTRQGKELPRDQMFCFLFRDLVFNQSELRGEPDPTLLIQHRIRAAAHPLFPSRRDLSVAAATILGESGWAARRPARGEQPGEHRRGERQAGPAAPHAHGRGRRGGRRRRPGGPRVQPGP